jgi:hypothetical protein
MSPTASGCDWPFRTRNKPSQIQGTNQMSFPDGFPLSLEMRKNCLPFGVNALILFDGAISVLMVYVMMSSNNNGRKAPSTVYLSNTIPE